MDYLSRFRHECAAFEAAARRSVGADETPLVPSCPDWSVADLVAHLGSVQRYVILTVAGRHSTPPDHRDLKYLGLPADTSGWPMPQHEPNRGPVPVSLVDWFASGASELADLFASTSLDEPTWTWSPEHTVDFWLRAQTLEAAVHRWDAENAVGAAKPIDTELAVDAIGLHFQFMAPFRRGIVNAPAGSGERFRFRQTDGPGDWTVQVEGDEIRLGEGSGPVLLEVSGTASDLLLGMWRRIPLAGYTKRYFELVPPA
ncbi:maleylpyruvate isomerase family mycothiol-dependent enzyme [Kibdelosporangium philippinense]|uniref:Maleylpyruvate isomerase family mycothiol-dependent enzyme n=1 Tax=Kibdelosporangium philippinense TaxID=211113 RepID=A0ABS8ZME0_9PSEU|nr:maleylpyruvate isomerase family mycothiol-dependent enzyme [Kibdelosporangium philippinense]MCE7008694.1 maleylpyruvate isomerase family mycothiol-dependent enzyme [Kibdelosporangium philippinense]